MGSTIGEPDTIEQLSGPPSRIARGDSGDPMRKRDVLFGRELGKKMVELEHEADPFVPKPRALLRREVVQRNAEDLDAPRIRTVDSAEKVQERALADPRRTAHPGEDALFEIEIQVLEDRHGSRLAHVGLGQRLRLDGKHRRRSPGESDGFARRSNLNLYFGAALRS